MDFGKDDVICEFVGKRCSREEAYNQVTLARISTIFAAV